MPAATSKSELIATTDKEYGKLHDLLAKVPADAATSPDDDGTSIKDVIGHRAHWIELFLGWYADGQAGKDVAIPAPGYNWSDLKRFNADLRKAQSGLDWDAAKDLLASNHQKLVRFIDGLDDAALYGAPMKGGGNKWTPGRWAEAAGPSHYRSASKYIRARLRALNAGP